MEEQGNSPSSSIDSSSYPSLYSASLSQSTRRDLSTDLRLGLSLSTSSLHDNYSNERSTLSEKSSAEQPSSFFVKVYMEGIPIGRKLDLFTLDGYQSLIRTLTRMFRTTIIGPNVGQVSSSKAHVLTYEDQEGDWMMVGDVPWEMFLITVKRIKIARADRC
ncbi:auxin-responsive protein IAA4-like [Asparagus officinalis]|uniref:auxin-responsive protein IAA4-like n=1 Tax=Asparagus officinalis TaxID=4686 RepID=UPI00098E871A|nr:auxin-responsive protein IAA4-like [Asparagus officinalis]